MPPIGVLLHGFAAGGHGGGAVIILHQLPPGDCLGRAGFHGGGDDVCGDFGLEPAVIQPGGIGEQAGHQDGQRQCQTQGHDAADTQGGDFLPHGAVGGIGQLWGKLFDDVHARGMHPVDGFIRDGAGLGFQRVGDIDLGGLAGLVEVTQRADAHGQGLELFRQRVAFQGGGRGGAAQNHLGLGDLLV